jgi:hypothetical protein
LLAFDWAQRFRIGDCLMIHIQLPQGADEADRPPCSIELKLVPGWLGKMDFSGSRRKPRPPETVGCTERPKLWKISR